MKIIYLDNLMVIVLGLWTIPIHYLIHDWVVSIIILSSMIIFAAYLAHIFIPEMLGE